MRTGKCGLRIPENAYGRMRITSATATAMALAIAIATATATANIATATTIGMHASLPDQSGVTPPRA